MLTVRYTRWDGRQRVRLDPDEIFHKLGEYLSYTDDVRQALDWLLHHGAEFPDMRVPGVDELLEEVRAQLRARFRDHDISRALDEKRRRLDELLARERDTIAARRPERPELAAKDSFLAALPPGLADAISRLADYAFEDAQAAAEFRELLAEVDDIRRLEELQRVHGEAFRGGDRLDYARARDLMHEIERLRQIEQHLMNADLRDGDRDDLRRILGAEAAENFENLGRMLATLQDSGYLMHREGHVALSPKGVRKIGQLALRDIYQGLLRDRPGSHPNERRGAAALRPEVSKPYRYGDPLNLDLVATLKQALTRRPGMPLRLAPSDFQVYDADDTTSTSTVLLLDMSWSMSWEGRFAAAKKVALAMESLIRSRYPRDYFAIVGFFTRAVELKLEDLPEASWNMGDPFTNLQDGLRRSAELLARHRSTNRHVIVVTDGQPTAYFQNGRLFCEWPLSFGGVSARAAEETLKEVERVTRLGITINTFMLDDSPSLRAFVERMTRINRGRALYTRPDRLGEYLLVDYVARKRKKV
ncbi:MAG: hypothetical protein B6D46_01975 [Polyangiaceae bacterium UTPRO1]|jgi:uncharacterized protein with von Willebrand factor type A (vWA) domain|nr:hypothetical protein [Myxococcales bacterium]OQY68891.1 MAG: hypothetical protein B6D46_01975 [Polyangiaceae bacterium UTPRO1]